MQLADVLKFLEPLLPLLKPEVLKLEQAGQDELKALVDKVASPDLKLLLQCLDGALDAFLKAEAAKLP